MSHRLTRKNENLTDVIAGDKPPRYDVCWKVKDLNLTFNLTSYNIVITFGGNNVT